MGKISKKNKNNTEPRVWDSLHDLDILLNSFEKYQFGRVLESSQLQNLYKDKSNEVIGSGENY